ncbi:tetratricopeptide repeat-containing sulfotransferase family protein [Allosphingosinicella sp.]|jgi:Flp pilus assembly protein TadD|uniref:tetratricopeptide repeat-containing sulfotransferase family protein n=1 Tax=Allosphingosinicella sp. TaxID=2823234 RepID=UPI002EF4549B
MNVPERLKLAVEALSRGDVAKARSECEAALRLGPNHPGALQLLGIAFCQSGELGRGADHLRRAMKHGGDSPGLRLNLARALLELGDLDEAERLSGESPGKPWPRDLQRMHADILKAQGRLSEAVGAYELLVQEQPEDFESWNNLGNARHQAGHLDGALVALERARALNPRSALIHTNLGRLLSSLDRSEDSCMCFQEAVRLAPRDPKALLEFGNALRQLDRSKEALVALADAARADPSDPRIFVAIGLAFTDLSDPAQAERAYRVALQVAPGFLPAYLNLGILLEQGNRLDELDSLIAQAAAKGVAGPEIDHLRALSARRHGRFEEALELARSNAPESLDPAIRAHFIGQVADRIGEVDTAFVAFEDMNRIMAETPLGRSVDPWAYQRDIDRLAALTTPEFYSAWPRMEIDQDPPSPVFLVGFPRSGTTLLDTILMGHERTHVLEEVPILDKVAAELGGMERLGDAGIEEVRALRARYFDELARVAPAPAGKMIIDKNPLSMIRAPLIHRLFPDARFILALRHPCDVVLSCFMQNFKVTESTAGFLDLRNASLTYDRVFGYWERCREVLPLRIHEIRYEAMVENLEGEVRPLLDFLGLEWDERILDHRRTAAERGHIRTPSYAQVTERLYSRASGRWERYRDHMGEALPILAPWVERLGYDMPAEPSRDTAGSTWS